MLSMHIMHSNNGYLYVYNKYTNVRENKVRHRHSEKETSVPFSFLII